MQDRLEEDSFLFQVFNLADAHDWTLKTVRAMTLTEFYGWVAYHQIKKEDSCKDG